MTTETEVREMRSKKIDGVTYNPYKLLVVLTNGKRRSHTIWSPGHPWLREEVNRFLADRYSPYDVKSVTVDTDRRNRSGGFYGTSRNVNQQFTKKGRHGTLRRYAIEYDDPIDPGFGKSLEYTWAYDVHHAIDMFMESLDGDSWRPLRIAAVTAGSPYGWHWQKV